MSTCAQRGTSLLPGDEIVVNGVRGVVDRVQAVAALRQVCVSWHTAEAKPVDRHVTLGEVQVAAAVGYYRPLGMAPQFEAPEGRS